MAALNCPRCDQPMTTQTVVAGTTSVVIEVCAAGCGGIWLDESDMRSGIDVTDDLQAVEVKPTYVPDVSQPALCPVCRQNMQRYRWNYTSPVTLDQCTDGHGTWVDHGEVQAMEEFEEKEVLSDLKKRQLQVRMGLDRMEVESELQRDVARTPSPLLNLVELVWRRFL